MFEFLFKYPASVFAKGKLVLLASWPVWILAAAVAAVLLILWVARPRGVKLGRAAIICALQAATLGVLLLMLWEPAVSVTTLRAQQNVVAILADDSGSMAGRRAEEAQVLRRILPDLQRRYQVRMYRVGGELERVSDVSQLRAQQAATRLDAALRQIADEAGTVPIGSVVLLSDGADTTGGLAAATMSELRRRRLPVNTVGFGPDHIVNDVELDAMEVTPKALAGSRLDARLHIRQNNFGGKRVALTLTSGGKTLASRQVYLGEGPEQTEHVQFNAGTAGVKSIEAKLGPVEGESNVRNNTATALLNVDGSKHRILYVEGEPRWEYKFIRRALEDDPAVTIVSMLRTTQNKIYRQGISSPNELVDGFPTKPEDLFGYDAIVLGSVEAGFFTASQQAAIRDFVDRRGGGLLLLGGRASLAEGGYDAQPFAELLPVVLPHGRKTFQRQFAAAELTDEGRNSLLCRIEDDPEQSAEHWDNLPYLADYQDAGTPKPGASVLARLDAAGKKLPLLVTENYGRGRTAVFASGGSWRWRMQQPLGDNSQEAFWRQLLRWTTAETPGRTLITASTRSLADEGRITFRAEVRDKNYEAVSSAQVRGTVTGPNGQQETIDLRPDPTKPGMYEASWFAPDAGSYVLEVKAEGEAKAATLTFRRENGVAENFHQEQNRDLLDKLATETGGRYYTPGDAKRIPDEVAFSDAGITSHETRDLWNMPIFFLLLLALRSAEWGLRRNWGYV